MGLAREALYAVLLPDRIGFLVGDRMIWGWSHIEGVCRAYVDANGVS